MSRKEADTGNRLEGVAGKEVDERVRRHLRRALADYDRLLELRRLVMLYGGLLGEWRWLERMEGVLSPEGLRELGREWARESRGLRAKISRLRRQIRDLERGIFGEEIYLKRLKDMLRQAKATIREYERKARKYEEDEGLSSFYRRALQNLRREAKRIEKEIAELAGRT